jgi:hypothetical protein
MSDYIKECTSNIHHLSGSLHTSDKVPISLFKQKYSEELYKTCQDCRDYVKNHKKPIKDNRKEKHIASVKEDGEFIYCSCNSHNTLSKYPREEVPKELFKKDQTDPYSPLFKKCEDCRISENAKSRIRNHKNHDIYEMIKYEFVQKYESCCYLCNNIFIYNPDIKNTVLELITYLIDDNRYVKYEDKEYLTKDFIELYKEHIPLSVLQLDHLTENEQRERGILKEDQEYIPKKDNVSCLGSEKAMKIEAAKCQQLCGKCHLLTGISREKGVPENSRNHLSRIKLKYLNTLKQQGCSLCGYINNNLPRFFHFDHLNQNDKIMDISAMTQYNKYSYDEFLKEIDKCRILCFYCHTLRTKNQRKENVNFYDKRELL